MAIVAPRDRGRSVRNRAGGDKKMIVIDPSGKPNNPSDDLAILEKGGVKAAPSLSRPIPNRAYPLSTRSSAKRH